MSAIVKSIISESEYLDLERQASHKSEYYRGEIFAMSGATKEHNAILVPLLVSLFGFLKGKGCKVYPSDLRVHNRFNSLYTYPDVIVVCGKEEYLDDKFDTLLNPTVIFEVLSPSTEDYDRGRKLKLYRSIPSLQNYVLVSSTEFAAEVYTRHNDQWILSTAKDKNDHIHISSINYDLKLSDIYSQLDEFEVKS